MDSPIGAWLACRARLSYMENEAFVLVNVVDSDRPATFFVHKALVEPTDLPQHEVDGRVQVTLLGRHNGTAIVEIPGEPVEDGPRVEVQASLID